MTGKASDGKNESAEGGQLGMATFFGIDRGSDPGVLQSRARQLRIVEIKSELARLLEEEAAWLNPMANLIDLKAECLALKAAGKLFDAVKLYRHHTSLSLREAKDAVEGMAATRGELYTSRLRDAPGSA